MGPTFGEKGAESWGGGGGGGGVYSGGEQMGLHSGGDWL